MTDDLSFYRLPASLMLGVTRRSNKTALYARLELAVAVAEAWRHAAGQAQAQEQRTYLAFHKAVTDPGQTLDPHPAPKRQSATRRIRRVRPR